MSTDRPTPTLPSDNGAPEQPGAEELERVLKTVPSGAFALAGTTVGLLVMAYLALYFLVFIPRGPIE
ncbi:hypothetical protein [Hyphomicrobium sp.]|uniref:hypothetical protein n=1 Tax=Hyphomicrobium sp. TaxID=82 RepID=UPI001E04AF0D|nr:hypothetical protein [Hyphomicrobium sp.]MBY0561121.1 hypothetical protein [Hyphomicrobium sp.]